MLTWFITAFLGLLALGLFGSAAMMLRDTRRWAGITRTVAGLICLLAGAGIGTAALGSIGLKGLNREVTAATIRIEKIAPQRFITTFTYHDQHTQRFTLAGDELYVDARIIKWAPIANLLGLHTAYELDRVSGRYQSLDDEQTQPRTVYSLARSRPVDLFSLVSNYPFLRPLMDAHYGSGTFLEAQQGGVFQVRVSTTGLLIRKLE